MTTYRVTNRKTFNEKVTDIDTFGLHAVAGGFRGTIEIELNQPPYRKSIWGDHGAGDYEQEYGFVLTSE